ncbi:hypothetical protein COLO4_30519 [Corchorus olitorius]|uniref:Uncharacterized protein n=1 Tax=Corchorus olitorius TaxID=93759 RepID=A0A1R3H865_9ROSI|nr:hypothetical protein COLO4_30519 [Corchorus olitorius]
MAEALISVVVDQLISVGDKELAQRVKLVRGVDAEVEKLTSNLQAIQAVLQDAEKRREKEAAVKLWLEKLKDVSYDVDDALDEWNTAILKLQNSGDTHKEFKVGTGKKSSCKLGDLGDLRHLEGTLIIRGMHNVEEASEAREARLSTKPGLRELVLDFYKVNWDKRDGENEAVVLEALHPSPSLQTLKIWYSNGPTTLFPSWMTSLTMLKTIELFRCLNWESLPPLGKLASLESLSISWMKKVKKVGEDFLGIERRGEVEESYSFTNIIAFPNLKELTLWKMEELEDWEYGNLFSNESSSSGGITIMPGLHSLTVEDCPKLKALPRHLFHHLQQLSIGGCPIISQRFEEPNGEDWPYISRIPNRNIQKSWQTEEAAFFGDTVVPKLIVPFVLRTLVMSAMYQETSPDLKVVANILKDILEISNTASASNELKTMTLALGAELFSLLPIQNSESCQNCVMPFF